MQLGLPFCFQVCREGLQRFLISKFIVVAIAFFAILECEGDSPHCNRDLPEGGGAASKISVEFISVLFLLWRGSVQDGCSSRGRKFEEGP